jgi:hypothetical protein
MRHSLTSALRKNAGYETAQVLYVVAFKIWLADVFVFDRIRATKTWLADAALRGTATKPTGFAPPSYFFSYR